MRPVFVLIILSIFLLFPTAALAQGMFLEPHESGLGFNGSMDRGEYFDTYGGAVGYSTTGIFDFGLGWTTTDIESEGKSYIVEHEQWIPYMNIGLVRPHGPGKVGVEFRGSYAFGNSSSDDEGVSEQQTSALTLGPVMYFSNPIGSFFNIQPEFAAYYTAVTSKIEGADDSRTEGDPIVTFKLHLVFGSPRDTKIILSPGLRSVGSVESWTLGLSIVTPVSSKPSSEWGS